MTYVRSNIVLGNGTIACYRWGQGPGTIVALHGYGEQAVSFEHWGRSIPEGFTLYAPDLPYHGHSTWSGPFTPEHLHELLQKLTNSPFTLCGFSMGGRLCLSYVQARPDHVSRLVLLAPDGLKVNFWYWLATQTKAGNRLFQHTMEHPAWFLAGVRLLGELRLVNRGIVRYVGRHLGEAAQRQALYHIWTCMRSFRPDLETVKEMIRTYHIPVRLIFGRYDRIIQPSQGYRFMKGLGEQCRIEEFSAGHQLLTASLTTACMKIVTD